MKQPVQSNNQSSLSPASLLEAFRTYLLTLGLSAISRKLYLADITRFVTTSKLTFLTISALSDVSLYASYLHSPSIKSSPTMTRRTLASLRQFGAFLEHTYDIPNPSSRLTIHPSNPLSPLSASAEKYIKSFTNYLKDIHLGDQSIKSYKSDVTQYLTYLTSLYPSTHILSLLSNKNLQKYVDGLGLSLTQSPATIARKIKTIHRFMNWCSSLSPQIKVSDNTNIAANIDLDSSMSDPVRATAYIAAASSDSSPLNSMSSPDIDSNFVKIHNYRRSISTIFSRLTLRHFLTAAILLLLVSTLSILTYRQFGRDTSLIAAYPSTPVTPNRQLSFQGRLENASGTPITSATNFVFKLFDASSGGSELYSSGTCSITPDTDGVFSTQIGSTCGSGIASSVFTENADVWLEITVAAETLTPRQQIATVAYALNSETIQGFPISATVSAIRNTVVPMNQWGEIIVGEQSPRLTGVSGTFQISAPSLSLVTATGTNGNITLAPDGTGQVNLNGNTTSTNFFNVSNAQLTTGSLITGTAANNNTGFKLLDLLSGSSPTSKFSVSDSGNTTIAGDLTITGDDLFMTTNTSGFILVADGTNYNPTAVSGDITLTSGGVTAIGNDKITEAMLKAVDAAVDEECLSYESTVGDFEWQTCGSGGGGSNWRLNAGTISPNNDTLDLLVGANATASAKAGFININSGTPTATVSAGTAGGAFLTADGYLSTTARQSLTLGNSSSYNTTGNILFHPLGGANLFFGDTSNANSSQGFTLNQGAFDDEIITLKSSDIAHGITGQSETDSFGIIKKFDPSSGGLTIRGIKDADGSPSRALNFDAYLAEDVSSSKGSSNQGLINFDTGVKPGGSFQDVAADGNLISISNNSTTKLIIDAESTIHHIPGSDISVDLITVQVTDTPTLAWNEASDLFTFSKGVGFGGTTYYINSSGAGNLSALTLPSASVLTFGTTTLAETTAANDSGAYLVGTYDEFDNSNSVNVQDVLDDLDLGVTTALAAATIWTDAGPYIYPTGSEVLGNSASAGANKLSGIYLGDNSPIVLGADNDNTISFNGTLTTVSGNTQFGNNAYFAGGTTYYVDNSGNAKFLDLQVADTGNAGLTVGNGSTGFAKIGSSTLGDNNTTYLSFDTDSDAVDEFRINDDGSVTFQPITSSALTTEGTTYYDTDNDHLYLMDGSSTWHRIALDMTKYASAAANIVNQNYVEIAHNQNTNDISLTAWVKNKITGLWETFSNFTSAIVHNLGNQFNPTYSQKQKVESVAIQYNENDLGNGGDGAATFSSDTNINTASGVGRSCGDAVNYSVTALTSTTATLEQTPSSSCLAAGDEILLINLRGITSAFPNVGNYETLRISSIATNVITFTTAKSKYYGDGASDDTNIGLGTSNQAVMLQRVPNYTSVTVSTSGTDVTPNDWTLPAGAADANTETDTTSAGEGGVMFFRATGTVSVASGTTINANAKGHTGGSSTTTANQGGNGGEAYCGAGGAYGNGGVGGNGAAGGGGGSSNYTGGTGYCGGGGGGGYNYGTGGTGSASQGGSGGGGGGYEGSGGGAGYGSAGTGGGGNGVGSDGGTGSSGNGGTNANYASGGGGGGTFGEADLARLYLAPGGGGGTFNSSAAGAGGDGGGVVYIAAGTVSVSGGIQSNGGNGTAGTGANKGGGGGGAGGSIKLVGNTLTLGSSLVTSTGGTGGVANTTGGTGGTGRIARYSTNSPSGTTNPVSGDYTLGYHTHSVFVSNEINTPNATSYGDLDWTESLPSGTNIQFQTRSGATADSTDGTWEAWKPSTATTNYLTLNNMDTHTDFTAISATPVEGDIARNVDYYEDEDEFTVGNLAKFTSSGFSNDTGSTLDDSLEAYWPLDETSGNRLDQYGSNTLTDTATVLYQAGVLGNAGDFESANNERLVITDNTALSTGDIDFTISAWVNMESETAATMGIVTKSNTTASSSEYALIYSGTGTDRFQFLANGSGGNICTVTANNFGAVTTATWYFIVASHDSVNNTCTISVNNGTADSAATTGAPQDAGNPFEIGRYIQNTANDFDGLIDEVGFWKKVLTSTEITDLYNSGAASTYPSSDQYAEDTISSTDLSGYDLISAWVYSDQAGNNIALGFGESAGDEQSETITIDAANVWQKVYWDISDITGTDRNGVTKLRVTITTTGNTVYVDTLRAEKSLLTTSSGSAITSTANDYIQYRAILTSTDTTSTPTFSDVTIGYTNPDATYTIDGDSIRQNNDLDYYSSARLNIVEEDLNNSKSINTGINPTDISINPAFSVGTGADGAITISSDTSINTTNRISGRICTDGGDAVNYSVTALTSTTATLESAPSTGCLNAGDEVLLINLRGSGSTFANVGNYETLKVESVASTTITFTTAKSNYYGDNVGDDTNIGLNDGNQAVMLQRVPNYTNVTITTANTDFYPDEWVSPTGAVNNGAGEGGVMFFRATGTVSVAASTTIHANAKGHLGGAAQASANQGGNGGEAYCGAGGAAGINAVGGNGAAGGGGGYYSYTGGTGYCGGGGGGGYSNGTGGIGSASQGGAGGGGGGYEGGGGGAGYGSAGTGGGGNATGSDGGTSSSGNGGTNANYASGGGGGGSFGEADLARLYLAPGGGGGTFNSSAAGAGGDGGGVVYIAAGTVSVSGGIQSNGGNGTAGTGANKGGGGGGAGGSIKLVGNTLTLGSSLVTSTGGAGGTANNNGGTGGDGRIATYYATTMSGSTNPAYSTASVDSNNYAIFVSDEINTPSAASYDKLNFTFDQNQYGMVQFQTRSGKSNNPTDGSWEAWKPVTNITTVQDMATEADWSGTLVDANGDITRNKDMFEDEDETTAGNLTKFSASGFEVDTGTTLGTSLVSYWPMNETSATAGTRVTRYDAYGTNHLTDNRSATSYILSDTGIEGNGANLELSNGNFFELSDNSFVSTGDIDYTLSAWVKLESETAGTTQETIVSKYDSASVREYSLYYTGATTDRFRFEIFNSSGTSVCTTTDTTAVGATWYHVVAWHDATGNTCNIKVNNNTTTSAAETGTASDTAANFRIGANSSTEAAHFDGIIDEVGFWKKALTSTEITDLYNSGAASAYPTSGQYSEDTITSTDLSSYDLLSAWVYSDRTGPTFKLGFGESAATENEETFSVMQANTWQKVYWDITDVDESLRNAVTKLRITNLTGAHVLYVDNIKAERLMSNENNYKIASTPNEYIQYRAILTTTNAAFKPYLYNINIDWNNGYKVVQTDANTVRLYNYTGETQEIRLDAVVFGADLAEWYTVSDDTIRAGDVVALTGSLDEFGVPILKKAEGYNDPNVVGAISTKAGKTLGIEAANRRLLGLAGRIPVKISPSSPMIEPGDHLTSSDIPGYATLANPGEKTIGIATTAWDPTQDIETVLVLINNTSAPEPTTLSSNLFRYIYGTNALINERTGRAVERIGVFANLLSPSVSTQTISPLASDQPISITGPVVIKPTTPVSDLPALVVEGEIEASTISARLAQLDEIQAETITAHSIVADTIEANHIIGLDAKIASFSSDVSDEEIETITDRIKDRLALLSGNTPSAEDVPIPEGVSSTGDLAEGQVGTAELGGDSLSATDSATLASADIDFVTINNYLAVIGSATITSLDITGGLYTESINSKSNFLALQDNTLIIDNQGSVMINGDLTVSGRILADSASLNSLELGTPSASDSSALGNLLAIYNEEGQEVATIDASGSANLASLTTNMITIASSGSATDSSALSSLLGTTTSNATAGVAVLNTPNTELVIESPYVTPNSLVYLTPTGNTDNKVLFVKSKVSCTPTSVLCTPSFTVGVDSPTTTDISFNWWIIQLAN